MAIKSIFFLLALMLLVTRMGLSKEDVDNIETEHHAPAKALVHAPAKAPVHAPAKAPVHAPAKAPVHAPAKAPVHAPQKAPFHAPEKAPVHASAPPPVHASPPVSPPHGCVAMCASYCKPISPRRPCMRTCTACCSNCKCVPGFMKCNNWNKVMIHGRMVNCP